MKSDLAVERLCRLPADFHSGSKSMLHLIAESGIDAYPEALAVPTVLTYITNHPELINEWLLWSANKRGSSGWYFSRQSNGFIVGFRPNGAALSFAMPELACAEFVVREVKALMEHAIGSLD
jgi:hypothetical protein